jgi:hypothetical protein
VEAVAVARIVDVVVTIKANIVVISENSVEGMLSIYQN